MALSFVSGCLRLKPGQRLVVYLDGVTEAQADAEEEYGEERLMEHLRGVPEHVNPPALIESLFEALVEFTGDRPQLDDLTVLVLDQPTEASSEPGCVHGARTPVV